MGRAIAFLVITALCTGTGAAVGQSRVPPTFPGVRSVAWIAAHPDDEVLVAPLLARLCVDEGLVCNFLVLTRGEAGPCHLPAGCQPSLGALRAAEMRRSAELFGAGLHLWRLPDGGGPGGWSAAAGGRERLVGRIASFLRATAPDLVLTFDPRHGSTCHPDHRAAAEIALEAMAGLSRAPAVFLLETRVQISTDPLRYRLYPAAGAAAGVVGWDAGQRLVSPEVPGWRYLLETAEIHASQFAPAAIRALRRVPRKQRTVFFAPATSVLAADSVPGCG